MRSAETHVLRNAKRMRIVAYVRLCSLMFAYVRLCSLNGKKNVEGAARGHPGAVRNRPIADCRLEIANWGKAWRGQWGTGKTARFQMSHCERFDIPLHRKRLRKCRSQDPGFVWQPIQSRSGLRIADCGLEGASGAEVQSCLNWGFRPRPLNPTKSDQIKPNQCGCD